MTEPTEMAGVAEAETQAAYAWALDYDDPDEFPTQPIQRLTSRHITALSLAASLVLIAMASVVALVVPSPKPSEPVVAAPPPVTVTAAPTTSTPQIHSGPSIGDECYDWMKFSTDPLSEQEMICSGYSENLSRGDPMTWFSAEEGAVGPSAGWADAPRVGRTGSSCSGEVPFTTGRSSDGYAVWCFGGPGSYMPGTKPMWTVYRPRHCLTLAPIGDTMTAPMHRGHLAPLRAAADYSGRRKSVVHKLDLADVPLRSVRTGA